MGPYTCKQAKYKESMTGEAGRPLQRPNALLWRLQTPYDIKAADHGTYSNKRLNLQKGTRSVSCSSAYSAVDPRSHSPKVVVYIAERRRAMP